jgi:hypothetical protein
MDPTSLPLRDIHLPAPIGWWPPAPGWWLLALALLGLATVAWLQWRRGRVRRLALARLQSAVAALRQGAQPSACVQEIAATLRRYCMTVAADPAQVAGLVGGSWLGYLDSRWPRAAFASGIGRLLVEAPYAPATRVADAEALAELGIEWLRAQPRRGRGAS